MKAPLRWAQGQGEHGHGTPWHIVVADEYKHFTSAGVGYGTPLQRTACGHVLVQSDSIELDDWRAEYLEDGGSWADEPVKVGGKLRGGRCPKCAVYLKASRDEGSAWTQEVGPS